MLRKQELYNQDLWNVKALVKANKSRRLVVLLFKKKIQKNKPGRQREHLEKQRWRGRSFHLSIMTVFFLLFINTHMPAWAYRWLGCSACYWNCIDGADSDHLCARGPAPSLSCNWISYDDFHKAHIMGSDIKTSIALTATEVCACWFTVAREGWGNEKHSHTQRSQFANKLS